jgi:hypothetical protein
MPNPQDDESLYDSIVLAGVRSPGSVKLSGHDRKVDWDVKNAAAQTGASTTLKSIPLVEFTATFYLVKDVAQGIDDFAAWPAFQALIDSTVAGSKPKALDVYHPDLASQDPPISSVVKALVGGVVHDGKGGQTITVKFQEYRPPKPKGGSPSGSKSKDAKKTAPDPDAAALAELQSLTDKYQKTGWDGQPVKPPDDIEPVH